MKLAPKNRSLCDWPLIGMMAMVVLALTLPVPAKSGKTIAARTAGRAVVSASIRTKWVGETFRGTADKEALAFSGRDNIILRRCTFIGGKTCLRFIDCKNVLVENCTFSEMAGPPDPDGQAIQFIRTTGTIRNPTVTASRHAEDLISIYADKPVVGAVLIQGGTLTGRGASDSSTSICIDGPCPPATTIDAVKIIGGRCGITLAGGSQHHIAATVTFEKCETDAYEYQGYPPAPSGPNFIDSKVNVLR